MASDALVLPALGQDVQLGMLYDARTSQFFSGVSLWNSDVVNANQILDEKKVQNAEFAFSYSLEEARKHAALDLEGSLSLDLGIVKATGSANYLNDNTSSTYEARLDVSCTIVRRTRRIPQEILASMQHGRYFSDARYTHFVSEVIEGGSATLSFVQSCKSAEEAKNISGALKLEIAKVPAPGDVKGEQKKDRNLDFESLKIFYSGAMAENVTSLEDARRVAHEMPKKLLQQLNTLTYKLLPLSILDNSVDRVIRSLDAILVANTAAALKAGTMARLKLKDLVEQDVFQTSFATIEKQIFNVQTAFARAEMRFKGDARRLLQELRDGATEHKPKIQELEEAVSLFEYHIKITEQFVAKKYVEAVVLRSTIATLLADGFEDHLSGVLARSLADVEAPRLFLSFGGDSISRSEHPLQKKIESLSIDSSSIKSGVSGGEDDDDDGEDEDSDEWFENPQTVSNIREACATLRRQRPLALPSVTFGVARVDKAYRPGKTKRSSTAVGDVVLDYKGKLLIVTGMLPEPPAAPTLTVKDQTISVAFSHVRDELEELAIPTTGFIVRFRPRPNALKDGAFPRASQNEAFSEIHCDAMSTTVVIEKAANGGLLFDNCDYEVEFSVKTIVGYSDWSVPVIGRTIKLPRSVASGILNFYADNRSWLSLGREGKKPWETCGSGKRQTLYLGHNVQATRTCTGGRYKGQLAVKIVHVAPEFEPSISAAPIRDQENTLVAVFAGCSGHGKSTEINAFVSYLLGGEVGDSARIMIIDDRGANQAASVTQYVTCYVIRPLSPLFEGKTLLIVDTPGYGDSRGIYRDKFVTAAMSELFKTIEHVNAIIFTCRSNEARTTLLSPVATYVFSLFAKDVKSCLRNIYTFSDAGAPLSRKALKELQWPVENGEVEVNNAAFTIELDQGNIEKVRDWWLMSIKEQFQVMQMLLRRVPVPIAQSAAVTQDRLSLEHLCELVEKKILRTANDAQTLIANLDALANAVGAAPGDKILIEEDKAVSKPTEPGTATMLCLECNWTCHEVCIYSDDNDKAMCTAMRNGSCTMCKGRCEWTKHKNAKYIIVVEKHSEWVVPKDLIKLWNTNNNTLEGALLDAIDAYLSLQEELRNDLLFLAQLTDKLMKTALLHDQTALIKYIDTLIMTARARGAPAEQLVQLSTAKNTLLLAHEIKHRGALASFESQTLLHVLNAVRVEMWRRMNLEPHKRAREEKKPCSLYNNLLDSLPALIQRNTPGRLQQQGSIVSGALYPENLRAIVKLVQAVLKDGGVVAVIAASNSGNI